MTAIISTEMVAAQHAVKNRDGFAMILTKKRAALSVVETEFVSLINVMTKTKIMVMAAHRSAKFNRAGLVGCRFHGIFGRRCHIIAHA